MRATLYLNFLLPRFPVGSNTLLFATCYLNPVTCNRQQPRLLRTPRGLQFRSDALPKPEPDMTRTTLTLLAVLTIASCQQPSSLTETEKARIAGEVRQTLDNYCTAVRRSGLTAEFQYLDNSSEFYWTPPGYTLAISYDSVAAILNQNARNFESVDNSFDTLKISPLTKEYATYTGRLISRMTDTLGQTTTFSLVETGVLIKREDGWKLLSGQTSILNK